MRSWKNQKRFAQNEIEREKEEYGLKPVSGMRHAIIDIRKR
jgi:hypothetical protein